MDFVYVYIDIFCCTYDLFWYRCYRDCSSSAAAKIIKVWSRVKQCCSSGRSAGLVWYILAIGYPIFVAKMVEKNVTRENSGDVDEDVGLWGATLNSWLPCAWSILSSVSCADFPLFWNAWYIVLLMVLHEPFRQLSTIKIGQTEGRADNCPPSNRQVRELTIVHHQISQAEGRQLSTIKLARQKVDNCLPSNRLGRG